MHDKAFIVDNTVAVIGGRNMSDPYFSADAQANFRDLDLFAAGPVVEAASQEFDEFWNSAWATSIHRLVAERPTPEQVREMVMRLHEQIDATPYPFRTAINRPFLEHFAERVRERLIWGKATLLADRPDKPMTSEPELAEALRAKVGGTVEKEVLMESAWHEHAARHPRRLQPLLGSRAAVRHLVQRRRADAGRDENFAGQVRGAGPRLGAHHVLDPRPLSTLCRDREDPEQTVEATGWALLHDPAGEPSLTEVDARRGRSY
jgi:cardiolipin synthase C